MPGERKSPGDCNRIRVTLDLRRSDDPALFEALASLPKGRRRLARLRVLAHDGLIAPEVVTSGMSTRSASVTEPLPADIAPQERADLAELDAQVTSGVFSTPLPQ